MSNSPLCIPQDNTRLPGMKTILADRADRWCVNCFRDVEYIRRGDQPLYLQILMPCGEFPADQPDRAPSSKRYPLVVFIQGSAWGEQNVSRNLIQLGDIARQGFVVASVQHRSSSVAQWPAFLQDVKSAIRFLRAEADRFLIDPEQVAVWGHSSGGHAALLVGLTGDMEEFKTADNHDLSDAVCAVCAVSCVTDVTHLDDVPRRPDCTNVPYPTPEDKMFGFDTRKAPEKTQVGNPITYVSADRPIPPIFIAHGDADSMVPFNQSVLLYEKLLACGKSAEFYKIVGGEHSQFLWTKQLLELISNFLNGWMAR